jgi:hypothetical protein
MACPDCFSGTVHEGHIKGDETKLHGLDVYVTGPSFKEARGIVVIIPDAFGWKFPNTRIWADEVARKGEWRLLLPEFMNGEFKMQSTRTLPFPGEYLTELCSL